MNENSFFHRRFKGTMLYRAIVVAAFLTLVLVVTGLLLGPDFVLAQSLSVFVGHWQGIDLDGSDIRLTIAGPPEGPFRITSTESFITFCNGESGIVRGTGWVNESIPYILEADLTVECFTTGASLDFHATWTYNPGTDTISSGGITYHHPGNSGGTIPPASPLYLRVNYGHDWVESFYEDGHTVWIAVMESDGATVKATAATVTEPKDFWGGETGFQTTADEWLPGQPDIQPYDWVFAWVDNGASAQVQLGEIQGEVFITTNTINGTITAPWLTDQVPVECLDWGSETGGFNKVAGFIAPNGSNSYTCNWDPDTEWDLQAWQEIGVGYFTPDGHWVADAFHAEHWAAFWTFELDPGFWPEGEYSYTYQWSYTYPWSDGMTMDPLSMAVASDAPVYPGYALIQPWPMAKQLAWTGSSCEVIPTVNPDQSTRFVWGWVNDYSMDYDEALLHFESFTVDAHWQGPTNGSVSLVMGELIPFYNRDDRWELRCALTEHPPKLDLRVNYGHDWVESFYEAGHTVWLEVRESDGVTVKATAESVTEPKDFWGGETGFQTTPEEWLPGLPDIQPYDWVFAWMDNGASAQVQIGDINGTIDLTADSITGAIYTPWFSDEVNVECHPWGSPEPVEMKFDAVLPDGKDVYACSWASEWDIQYYQDVGVGYFGLDGHWVANAFFMSTDPGS